MNPQIIKQDGQPAFAVLPIGEYRRLRDAADMLDDVAAFDAATHDESFPAHVADRLIEGEHPIRVFREYRGLSAAELASTVGISRAAMSQIESGKRSASVTRLTAIAEAFGVGVDDLIV